MAETASNIRRPWESRKIGTGTRIWAMAHVLSGTIGGEDCNICDHTFIENDIVIGNRGDIRDQGYHQESEA
jgi:UDP-3-O-[3-hydroxymyristoyl] glucosamine N-acyltransferase